MNKIVKGTLMTIGVGLVAKGIYKVGYIVGTLNGYITITKDIMETFDDLEDRRRR